MCVRCGRQRSIELQCDTNLRLFGEENEVGSPFVLLSRSARNNELNYTSPLKLATCLPQPQFNSRCTVSHNKLYSQDLKVVTPQCLMSTHLEIHWHITMCSSAHKSTTLIDQSPSQCVPVNCAQYSSDIPLFPTSRGDLHHHRTHTVDFIVRCNFPVQFFKMFP